MNKWRVFLLPNDPETLEEECVVGPNGEMVFELSMTYPSSKDAHLAGAREVCETGDYYGYYVVGYYPSGILPN